MAQLLAQRTRIRVAARDLARITKLKSWLKPAGALWVVYPKGVPAVREIEVLEAGRAAGLKDTKVARFSATHTALRFEQTNIPGRLAPRSQA